MPRNQTRNTLFPQYRFTREEQALLSLKYPDIQDFEEAAAQDRWLPCRVLPFYSLRRRDWAVGRTDDSSETSTWHRSRQKSAIWKALLDAEADGHCWTDWKELKTASEEAWGEDDDFAWHDDYETCRLNMSAAMKELVADGECAYHKFKDAVVVSWAELARQEQYLSDAFSVASAPNPSFAGSAKDLDLSRFGLLPEQEKAMKAALRHSTSLISGPAGSGKSHTLSCLDALYREAGKNVVMYALTGKLVLPPAHSWKLHHRNLFYTGVTRAKEGVFVLGTQGAIDRCAKTVETGKRKTLISYFAWKASKNRAA